MLLNIALNIAELRQEYAQKGFGLADLDADPFQQFELWFQEACNAELLEPNAMILATATSQAEPCQRTVLLKYFDRQGLVFFTNYESRKAGHIAANPQVSVLFPWYALERQVQINGMATKIPIAESLQYFATRPRGSQIGAWCSQQSTVISSRQILEMQFEKMKEKFRQGDVPIPPFWGGYRIIPQQFEFWQGRSNRLHDRFVYQLQVDDHWIIQRLSP